MASYLIRPLFLLFIGVACSAAPRGVHAAELLVFVSAFAPGDDGAIHAYRIKPETGLWRLLHRTTDVEHPFFMALSPN